MRSLLQEDGVGSQYLASINGHFLRWTSIKESRKRGSKIPVSEKKILHS
jgi:hypothetical protein